MDRINLKLEHWDTMLDHVKKRYPEEACGILGGIDRDVIDVIPVTNVLHSPTRYRMDPREQLNAMQQIEENGHSVIGIFHSHINGPEGLSFTDLREVSYPEAAYLVWSRKSTKWDCKAFMIEDGRGIEIPLLMLE